MKTQRVERIVIRKSHPKWKVIDEMCLNSKNLYNYANYIIRQEFIKSGNYINYFDMNKELKTHQQYKDCMSQLANSTLRLLDKNWKSYFSSIKDWKKNPDKYFSMPKIPKYLKKDGRYPWMIPNNTFIYNNKTIHFRIRKLQGYTWKSRCIGRPIQARFIPKGTCYILEIVYEIDISNQVCEKSNRIASIDIGVDNLATMTNNIGINPIIINGKGIKSINQYYNKMLAKEKSSLKRRNGKDWSNKLDSITFKRNQRVNNYMHNTSHYITKWCIDNDIDTLVIGHNKEWKQESSMNKTSNQKFIMVPFNVLLWQLEYKCQNVGIKFVLTEESYTSGTSFLDGEEPTKEKYNKDRRIERGLFKTNSGRFINSDVNGSLQIMKKVFPNAFSECYGIEGVLNPTVISVARFVA